MEDKSANQESITQTKQSQNEENVEMVKYDFYASHTIGQPFSLHGQGIHDEYPVALLEASSLCNRTDDVNQFEKTTKSFFSKETLTYDLALTNSHLYLVPRLRLFNNSDTEGYLLRLPLKMIDTIEMIESCNNNLDTELLIVSIDDDSLMEEGNPINIPKNKAITPKKSTTGFEFIFDIRIEEPEDQDIFFDHFNKIINEELSLEQIIEIIETNISERKEAWENAPDTDIDIKAPLFHALSQEDTKFHKTRETTGNCWIASAYYGSTCHPNVIRLRNFRNQLLKTNIVNNIVKFLNATYYFIGKTKFGRWWAKGLSGKVNFRLVISKCFLKSVFLLEKLVGNGQSRL